MDDFFGRVLIAVIPSCFSLAGSVVLFFLESVGTNGRLKRVRLLAEMSELAEKNPELTSLKTYLFNDVVGQISWNKVSVDPVITSNSLYGGGIVSDQARAHCPSCGAPLEPGMAFCVNCGDALHTESLPAGAAAASKASPHLYPMPCPSVGRQGDRQPVTSRQIGTNDSRDDGSSTIRILLGCAAALYVVLILGLSGSPLGMLWNALAGLLGVLLVLAEYYAWKRFG